MEVSKYLTPDAKAVMSKEEAVQPRVSTVTGFAAGDLITLPTTIGFDYRSGKVGDDTRAWLVLSCPNGREVSFSALAYRRGQDNPEWWKQCPDGKAIDTWVDASALAESDSVVFLGQTLDEVGDTLTALLQQGVRQLKVLAINRWESNTRSGSVMQNRAILWGAVRPVAEAEPQPEPQPRRTGRTRHNNG